MEQNTFDKTKVVIASAGDVNPVMLQQFYALTYPDRLDLFRKSWQWINRSDFYDHKIPLVLMYESRVIAHAGIMPVVFNFQGETMTASWFIDFAVLPEFQRYGLGNLLTKEWMKFSDIQVTFCNEKSIIVFKKNGWVETFNTYMHTNMVTIFNHPRWKNRIPSFFRKGLNTIFYPLIYAVYARHAYKDINKRVIQLEEGFLNVFAKQYDARKSKVDSSGPARDINFLKWRLLNSPYHSFYYSYQGKDFSAIISMRSETGGFIDVLCVSDVQNKIEIRNMICSLGLLALKHSLSRIRFYTSDKNISDDLKRTTLSFVRHPRFAFYSDHAEIHERLKTTRWELELIDSDFELVL